MTIEIIHHENSQWPTGVSHSEKIYRLFGLVILRKIFRYPKVERYDVVYKF